jgi:two-component system nitrate/nitrite response regulator NarL
VIVTVLPVEGLNVYPADATIVAKLYPSVLPWTDSGVQVIATPATADDLLAGPGRDATRAGALGYVLKNEETSEVRAAIRAVATGKDWISSRLACIFATDDAPDRPLLSRQETRALQLYATGMAMKSVARRMCISEETAKQYVGRVREKYARGRAAPTKFGPVLSSRRGRASPPSPLTADPPPGARGNRRYPSSTFVTRHDPKLLVNQPS